MEELVREQVSKALIERINSAKRGGLRKLPPAAKELKATICC